MNVLFDLDGTLTDPREGIVACMKHALASLHRPVPGDAELERFIGPPLRNAFCELLSAPSGGKEVGAAVAAFRERFTALGMFENRVYDGIPQALEGLLERGARLFVATSKPRVFAEQILEHFGLAGHFAAIYGSELTGERSDKVELIAHALTTSALHAAGSVMVGDRRYDVWGALANEVRPVGVLWGYGSREELAAAGADDLFDEPGELGKLGSDLLT